MFTHQATWRVQRNFETAIEGALTGELFDARVDETQATNFAVIRAEVAGRLGLTRRTRDKEGQLGAQQMRMTAQAKGDEAEAPCAFREGTRTLEKFIPFQVATVRCDQCNH